MIVEYSKNGVTITNNSIADQIADCEYYLTAACMGYTSHKTKQKWLRKLKKLREEQDKLNKKEDNH